jgi:hypothetical protein
VQQQQVSVAKIAYHSPDRRISNLASYDCQGLASHEPLTSVF